jgi:hypothetical protein
MDWDDGERPVHCLLWNEGKKARCFTSGEKALAHAAKMDRAARLVKSGKMSTAEVEDGVTAAACSPNYRFWQHTQFQGSSLYLCFEKANVYDVCDDHTGKCGIEIANRISSWQKITTPAWAAEIFDEQWYAGPSWWYQGSVRDLNYWGWNDRAESLDIW